MMWTIDAAHNVKETVSTHPSTCYCSIAQLYYIHMFKFLWAYAMASFLSKITHYNIIMVATM